jgi:threonyl-tRNA synthetase
MQLLLIHSDYIEYETKKRTPVAEEIDPSMKSGRMEDGLTAFVAVESYDEADPIATAENAVGEIRKLAEQVKIERIMLYPYAHWLVQGIQGQLQGSPAFRTLKNDKGRDGREG